MAQPVEPMDTDDMSEFDNKENSIHHSNVFPQSTEKGYEELDVSELNMKLRYSFTPLTSPMSKSYTANCVDNRRQESEDIDNTVINENGNLTRSVNSIVMTPKSLPLQSLPLDGTVTLDNPNNVTVTVTGTTGNGTYVSFPSSSSSSTNTPEATSPVTEVPKPSGSPILRGLKSVLSMFRPSQSPTTPEEQQGEVSSPPVVISPVSTDNVNSRPETMLSSTPLTTSRRDCNKRGSPLKESLVFNEDLEKELAWNDETTIIFSKEKIPIHKLFYQQPKQSTTKTQNKTTENSDGTFDGNLNSSIEPMDISYNNSTIKEQSMTETLLNNFSEFDEKDITIGNTEKDESVFLDCETTFSMDISQALNATKENINAENEIPVVDMKHEFVRADLDGSLGTHMSKHDETYMSMFSAEFQPELEEIKVNKAIDNKELVADNSLIKVADVKQNTLMTDDLAPVPENVQVMPTTACLNQIINAKMDLAQDKDNDLDIEEVPESIQKTLEETLFRMDGTHCFDETVDVINRIEAAIRQQDDEFMEAPTNSEKNDFETTLSNLVNNISSKDTTPMTDLSIDVTVRNCEGVDTSKPDLTYVAENIPLPSESDDSQDEQSIVITTENELDIKDNNLMPHKQSSEIDSNVKVSADDKHDIVEQKSATQAQCTESESNVLNVTAENKVDTDEKTVAPQAGCTGSQSNALITTTEHQVEIEEKNVALQTGSTESDLNTPVITSENKVDTDEKAAYTESESNTQNFTVENKVEIEEKHMALQTDSTESDSNAPNITDANKLDMEENFAPQAGSTESDLNLLNIDSSQRTNIINDEKIAMSIINSTSDIDIAQSSESEVKKILTNIGAQDNKVMTCIDNSQLVEGSVQNTSVVKGLDSTQIIDQTIPKVDEQNLLEAAACNEMQALNTTDIDLAQNIKEVTQLEYMDTEQEKIELQSTLEFSETKKLQEIYTNEISILQNNQNTQMMSFDMNEEHLHNETDSQAITKNDKSDCAIEQTIDNEVPKTEDTLHDVKLEENCASERKELTETLNNTITTEHIQPKTEHPDKEIVISESNSPFVSLSTEDEDFSDAKRPDSIQHIELLPLPTEPIPVLNITKPSTVSEPLSPKLPGKGAYNFNFDEMNDPFATNSKIRFTPSPDGFKTTLDTHTKEDGKQTPATAQAKAKTKTVNELGESDSTFSVDTTVFQPSSEKYNTTVEVTSIKTNLTVDFNKLNMTNRDDDLQSDLPLPNDVSSTITDQSFNAGETKVINEVNSVVAKSERVGADDVYEEGKDDTSEKEQESLDDFAMEENKISDELNSIFQEKTKSTSSSEQSTYLSVGTSLEQKENFDETNCNPFATKSKISQSPPPINNEENPFATRSKIASSPVTSFIATYERNEQTEIAAEDATLKAKIASQEAELANDIRCIEEHAISDLDDCKDGSGTSCSESSRATDEKDVTIKEVLTEDEDTMEGPFIDAELGDDDGKPNPEKMFDDAAKITLNGVDMNNFTDLLAQPNEENFEAGEMFIDADAFEFLMNQNKSNELDENGKESLFLKFDPLFTKRVNSDGIVDALAKLQKRQSTPKKIKPAPRDLMSHQLPIAGPSNVDMSLDESHDDMNATVSHKPTMVVPPAVNTVPSPRKATTPTRANRLSMNFTSPAMAVIDRLLSMSGNNSLVGQDTPNQVSREYSEADRALTQFRELLAEKELNVHQLRCESKDLKDRLAAMESKMSSLESENEKRLKNIGDLNKKLDEKDKMNKNMASVVEEYERTIAGLIAGIEEDKKAHAEERIQLIKERDEESAHLASMEVAFNDLHSKYEKSKQIIFSYKAKEDIYKKSIHEFEENLVKMEKNYESLKQHATSKLNFANQELEKINKSHESEVVKLNAMMKRKDLHISSLEETLAQKSKANEELTAICDELINKVG